MPMKRQQPHEGADDTSASKRMRAGILKDDLVCFTGLSAQERERLAATLHTLGAVVHSDLLAHVTVLVAGHSNTEKVHLAQEKGIPVASTAWVRLCADATNARPDPGAAECRLRPLCGFTVVTSGYHGEHSKEVEALVAEHGGRRDTQLREGALPARTAVVVRKGPEVERGEVLSRDVVKQAYKLCVPVVWSAWLHATAEQGHVSEALLAQHSVLIDSEPAVATRVEKGTRESMRCALQKPLAPWAEAPLRGVTAYLHRGDAGEDCLRWATLCLVRLGAARSATVDARTTHIIVASPESRQLVQRQRIAQIALGSLAPPAAPASAFPAGNVVAAQWLFDTLVAGARLPTAAYAYSLEQPQEGADAQALQQPAPRMPQELVPRAARPAGAASNAAQPLKKARKAAAAAAADAMPPPPVPAPADATTVAGAAAVMGVSVARAQEQFGKSQMFQGRLFVMSPNFAKEGRKTATQMVFAHGGRVLTRGKVPAGDAVSYFVDPHHPSRETKAHQGDAPPKEATVVTEDWIAHCFHFLQGLRQMSAEQETEAFEGLAAFWEERLCVGGSERAAAVVHVNRVLAGLEAGTSPELLPHPCSHFLFTTAVHRRHAMTDAAAAARGAPALSPFLQHGKLRTVKKETIGVAVCIEGVVGYRRELLRKTVELLGGTCTNGFDSHATTHVVVDGAFYASDEGRESPLLRSAAAAAERGGADIVLGVVPAWLEKSAEAGYFVDEESHTLFPRRATADGGKAAAAKADAGGKKKKKRAADVRSPPASEPTPVVRSAAAAKAAAAAAAAETAAAAGGGAFVRRAEPCTPSPRACLDFDTTTVRNPNVKVFFALTGSAKVLVPARLDVALLRATVMQLGGLVADTCGEATHLVTSSLSTTETVCIAMASGKWVVSPQWVEESGAKSAWQPEANYEWSHEMVADVAVRSNLSLQSREVERTSVLASACQHWRRGGGGAFQDWEVLLIAGDVFENVLRAGGADIVSRALPPSWEYAEGRLLLVDKSRWNKMIPSHRDVVTEANGVVFHKLGDGASVESVKDCTGLFLWIDAISAHLQRNFLDLKKLMCGCAATAEEEMPDIPWA
eukprot:Rhum_TRINITY_DN14246_c7_g1::Rhum_TRINITY_DN14246_c7_g1_i1::g.75726::m.75726